ncbi:hypothetical protein PBI_FLOOF_76 [Microbacterium phage Floof]|uniref:Uncharacterized protein n=1 Tax=Microbacterium phage Floof TaxID=2201433 RepID=A0A2Z4Q4D9_9CAUD|nr:hypothetical protein PBI_FLOOF_76 [Microbacterium phage Floof]
MYRSATVAEIETAASKAQEAAGPGFIVRPNSYGIRAECVVCHEAASHDRAYRFFHEHTH